MALQCFVLKTAISPRGLIAILDFPPGETPYVGLLMHDIVSSKPWKIIGMGLPIELDLVKEKIETRYHDTRVWDCMISPIGHSEPLKDGCVLTFNHISYQI